MICSKRRRRSRRRCSPVCDDLGERPGGISGNPRFSLGCHPVGHLAGRRRLLFRCHSTRHGLRTRTNTLSPIAEHLSLVFDTKSARLFLEPLAGGPWSACISVCSALCVRQKAPLPQVAAGRGRAMILYTSGTTSRPKGVVTTHVNIAAQIESLMEHLGMVISGSYSALSAAPPCARNYQCRFLCPLVWCNL